LELGRKWASAHHQRRGTEAEEANMRTPDLVILAYQAAISLCVAVLVSFVTVWLALRRFYREKWWEAKMRAYTGTAFHNEWRNKHRVAWDNLEKFADVGEFLFSVQSINVLRELINQRSAQSDNYVDYLEGIQIAVEKCLPAIKASARSDLS
jgi:hypothetical protein